MRPHHDVRRVRELARASISRESQKILLPDLPKSVRRLSITALDETLIKVNSAHSA